MSRIAGKETKPEILVRKFLFRNGFRYRKNVSNLPGKPDIVLPKHKAIVFVNGCFWHGHKKSKNSSLPQTNRTFWELKVNSNIERDSLNQQLLRDMGWTVLIIWQCEINNRQKQEIRLRGLMREIKGNVK